jgi:ABC-type glutathione transport system ATPase component
VIEVTSLSKRYIVKDIHGKKVSIDALKQTAFCLYDHTGYALVGESGSGKSTLARLLMCVERPTSGEIWFDGKNITAMCSRELRQKRAKFQMVFQNAQSSLDPRCKVYDSIAEPLRCLTPVDRDTEYKKIVELSDAVQLPSSLLDRLPHELSGGQQKRVCIARAMSVSPKFIIFDESVSGLDVTIRKQVLDLILRLYKEGRLNMFLFITHDIDVALYMAQKIYVMKDGAIVEQVEKALSYADFSHPYSKLLIESLPSRIPKHR